MDAYALNRLAFENGRKAERIKFLKLTENFCADYCKYIGEYKDPDDLFDAHCCDCPLNNP